MSKHLRIKNFEYIRINRSNYHIKRRANRDGYHAKNILIVIIISVAKTYYAIKSKNL